MPRGEALIRLGGQRRQVVIGLPVVGDHVAAIERALKQHAKLAVEELVCIDDVAVDFFATAKRNVADADFAEDAAIIIVQTRARNDVDVARDRAARHVGRDRLVDDDLAGDRRGNVVEARVAAFGADDLETVEGDGGPVAGHAANVHVSRLALVSLKGDAGQTAHGEGDVLVGQVADVVG